MHVTCMFHAITLTYMNYRTWENFGVGKSWRIWQIEGHSPIFYLPMFLLGSVLAIHVAHLPIFYPPIDSDQCIRQCFTLPKFSHIQYMTCILLC